MTNLISTLNEMLDNVREAALSKERFHTSASHELRAPLQALSGHLGVALSRERSVTEYRSVLEEAAHQTTRLGKLTGICCSSTACKQRRARPCGNKWT